MRTLLIPLFVVLSCQVARAEYEGASFGDQGVLVPSGVVGFDFSSENTGGDTATRFTLQLSPRLMYFLSDNFALGGDLSLVVTKAGDADAFTTFGIGPRVGFNLRLGDRVSWFPNAGLHVFASNGIVRIPLDIEAPFLIHFGNFFIGIGPALAVDIWGRIDYGGTFGDKAGYRLVIFRISTSLGGWIPTGSGGDWSDVMPPPDETSPHTAPPPPPPPPDEQEPTETNEDEWT